MDETVLRLSFPVMPRAVENPLPYAIDASINAVRKVAVGAMAQSSHVVPVGVVNGDIHGRCPIAVDISIGACCFTGTACAITGFALGKEQYFIHRPCCLEPGPGHPSQRSNNAR